MIALLQRLWSWLRPARHAAADAAVAAAEEAARREMQEWIERKRAELAGESARLPKE